MFVSTDIQASGKACLAPPRSLPSSDVIVMSSNASAPISAFGGPLTLWQCGVAVFDEDSTRLLETSRLIAECGFEPVMAVSSISELSASLQVGEKSAILFISI